MMPSASASLPDTFLPPSAISESFFTGRPECMSVAVTSCPNEPRSTSGMPSCAVLGREHDVVAVHDAERAAEAIAVHLRDHDAREGTDVLGDLDREVGPVPVEHRAVRHLAQEGEIEPRGIDRAGAPRDDDLELLVGADDVERFEEGVAQRPVPAVALLRPVERDAGDARVRRAGRE